MLEQKNIFAERIGTGNRVLAAIAREFNTDVGSVKSPWKNSHIVKCRFVIARLLCDLGYSTSQIGKTIGGRDHSTVVHALKRFDNVYQDDVLCRKVYDRYSAMMKEVRDV